MNVTIDQTKKIAPTDKNPIPVMNSFILGKGILIDFNPNSNNQLPVIRERNITVLGFEALEANLFLNNSLKKKCDSKH